MSLPFALLEGKSEIGAGFFQSFRIVNLLDLLRFYADIFVGVCTQLGSLSAYFQSNQTKGHSDRSMPPWLLTMLSDSLAKLGNLLREANLSTSLKSAKAFQDRLGWEIPPDKGDIQQLINELTRMLVYELQDKLTLLVPSGKAEYYDGSLDPFSIKIREAFPSADRDMTEACKCYALNRHTACVFHLMRVMEAGLNALSKKLKVPIGKNWNTVLNMIEKEIKSRNTKTHGQRWKKDEPFYSGVATHFRFVKNAWRNYVSHLHEHYDEGDAKAILNSVSAFMRDLSVRLHE